MTRSPYLNDVYEEDGVLYCDDPVFGKIEVEKVGAVNSSHPLPKKKERYVRTIPLEWAIRAGSVAPMGGLLALCLWYYWGLERKDTIRLTTAKRELFGVDEKSGRRLLNKFEQAGLVRVERTNHSAPMVTLIRISEPKT